MRIVNQNLFFSFFLAKDLARLAGFKPDVLCLQEFSGKKFDLIANNLFKEYALTVTSAKAITACAILTTRELSAQGEFYIDSAGTIFQEPGKKSKFAFILWIDLKKQNEQLRIYNCHFPIDYIGFAERAKMLEAIIQHAQNSSSVLILGDMNTTIPQGKLNRFLNSVVHKSKLPTQSEFGEFHSKSEKYYFSSVANKHNFFDLLDIETNTWRMPYTPFEVCNVKLDWVLQKNVPGATAKFAPTPWHLDHKTIVVDIISTNTE